MHWRLMPGPISKAGQGASSWDYMFWLWVYFWHEASRFCWWLIVCGGRESEQAFKWKWLSHVRLCNPMVFAVHRILQARILEWGAFPFSRGSPQPRDWTWITCIAGGFFTYRLSHKGSPSLQRSLLIFDWSNNSKDGIDILWDEEEFSGFRVEPNCAYSEKRIGGYKQFIQ